MELTRETVFEVLAECYDPEIPVNIVDLGLIYNVSMDNGVVLVTMTLTAPGCHMSAEIRREIEEKLLGLPGCREACVEFVWEPPWGPHLMSEQARKVLRLE